MHADAIVIACLKISIPSFSAPGCVFFFLLISVNFFLKAINASVSICTSFVQYSAKASSKQN
ncbi:unnamed protein product [Meloidogyne enterolobii]|uniref:Uncharacterized protein n=1 Tax=Meloidogyne enterolobii TaxID=390850 RepID=A0ACB0YVT2_MELEN